VDGLLDIGDGNFHPDPAISVSNRTLTAVPEPSSGLLALVGLVGVLRRRKRSH